MKISRNQIRLIKHNGNYTTNDVVKIVVELLNQQGLTWWLDYGQLLSLHRSGEPLKWKDDWDFCIVQKDDNSFDDILKKIRKITNVIFERNGKYIRFDILDLSFDFYFCKEDFEKKIIIQKNFENGGFEMPIFFYDRLDTINFDSIELNVPRHLDYYLNIRYGDDWIIPIKKDMSNIKVNVGQQYKKEYYTCLIAGVFDGLHQGHQNLIEHSTKYFDKVKIGVHSNEVVEYKDPPKHTISERIDKIVSKYPNVEIIEGCPLITDKTYLELNKCDYVVFGDENSDNMNKFYPSQEVNHPIDRYPILSSRLVNKQSVKSFCINMKDKEERYIDVLKEMSKIGIYPERFMVNKHEIEKRIKREGVNEKSNQILESHLRLYKKLSQTDGDIFLILEDDVMVIDKINLDEVISDAPKDWDAIYLGGVNHHEGHPPVIIDEKFYRAKFTFNSHALLVKKSFIPCIIDELEKREFELDVIFAYMQSKGIGNWYGLIEDSIIQHGKYNTSIITTLSESCFDKVCKLKGIFNIKLINDIRVNNFNEFMKIDVSIIIPFYRRCEEFKYALVTNKYQFSLVNEVIIVFDEPVSIDEYSFLLNYTDINFKFYQNVEFHEWRNPAVVINKGINVSESKYCIIMSPESILCDNAIKQLVYNCDDNSYTLGTVIFSTYEEYEKNENFKSYFKSGISSNSTYIGPLYYGSICATKNNFKLVGLYEEDFSKSGWGGEDTDIRKRLSKSGILRKELPDVNVIHLENYTQFNERFEGKKGKGSSNNLYNNFIQINLSNEINLIKPSFAIEFQVNKNICKKCPIILLLQSYNESSNIELFLKNIIDFVDGIIVLDDNSTDDTWDKFNMSKYPKIICKVKKNRKEFNDIENRNYLLEILNDLIINHDFNIDWFMWLDLDEIVTGIKDDIRSMRRKLLLNEFNADILKLPLVHMWNDTQYNLSYPYSKDGIQIRNRLIRNIKDKLPYSIKTNKKLHFDLSPYDSSTVIFPMLIKHLGRIDENIRKLKYDYYLRIDTNSDQLSYEHLLNNSPELKEFIDGEYYSNFKKNNKNS